MPLGSTSCRNFRMPTAHTGRPYMCYAVTLHVALPRMHCKCGKGEPDAPEALKYTETDHELLLLTALMAVMMKAAGATQGGSCCEKGKECGGRTSNVSVYHSQGNSVACGGRPLSLPLCYQILAGGRGSGSACGQSCQNLSIWKHDSMSAMSLLTLVMCWIWMCMSQWA